jgi:hypothetical protein
MHVTIHVVRVIEVRMRESKNAARRGVPLSAAVDSPEL